jgi:hypothetical protein
MFVALFPLEQFSVVISECSVADVTNYGYDTNTPLSLTSKLTHTL